MRKINLPTLLITVFILLCGTTILNANPNKHNTMVHHQQTKQKIEGKVDINKATSAQLQTLKGIGLRKAEAIVAYREEHGTFHKMIIVCMPLQSLILVMN